MKKIVALISLGLIIVCTCSLLGAAAKTEVPILSVGDQWTALDQEGLGLAGCGA